MSIRSVVASGLLCILFWSCAPVFAQNAGIAQAGGFIPSTPVYESDASARGSVGFGGPEGSARPGEVFFRNGARAFRNKDYVFAIQMYEVAASWAYKPAEYNLGVMYARGQGVDVDLPRALAWMALAAERGDKDYVRAREAVYAAMSGAQFAEANVIWRDLKPTYGDAVALQRAKTRWKDVLRSATGSHAGFVGNLVVGADHAIGRDQKTPGFVGPGFDTRESTISTAPFESTGGAQMDGSLAYRQLRESDNPYDPKFARGTATVGPLITAQSAREDAKVATPVP